MTNEGGWFTHERLQRLRLVLLVLLLLGFGLVACNGSQVSVDNQPPTVQLLNPQPTASYPLDEVVDIQASASDPDGSVSRVVFYVDDQEVSTIGAAPYEYRFTPNEARLHRIAARAYDDEDASSELESVTIEVQEANERFDLTVTTAGEGTGAVSSSPGGIACPGSCEASFSLGEEVTLTATPEMGSSFGGWQGVCAEATATTCTFSRSSSEAVQATARFTRISDPVTVSLSPESAVLEPGQAATFTATVIGSDQGVSWSADGGTVAGEGLVASYTAPAEPGSYTVTVSSVADPSAQATAAVTVSDPVDPDVPFTVIALPDTQGYVCSRCTSEAREWQPEIFEAQTQWVVDNLEAMNIVFVATLGDFVECAGNEEDGCSLDGKDEWAAADRAMDLLDGKVPYAGTIGDHDYFPEETRYGDTSNYVRYFGDERYQGYSWYGGAGPDELSHYQIFPAGPYTFLNISLEFEARDETLAWAQGVIDANAGVPTIVTTHGYVQDTPGAEGRSTVLDVEPPIGNTGEQVFRKLVAPNPQVFMVLNGHYHDSERENTGRTSDNGEYHQVSRNDAGHPVYEMLSDYQDYDNGGDGWLRIIQFLPGEGEGGLDRIKVSTYSPTRNDGEGDYQPGDASNFYFDLDFEERFR